MIFSLKIFACIVLQPNLCRACWVKIKNRNVFVSQELVDRANTNENFLKNIVTGDKTWVYGYDVKTKAQSSQWNSKTSPKHGNFGPTEKWCWLSLLIGRTLLITNFYLVARRWTRNVIWRWWIDWQKQWGENGLICRGAKIVTPTLQRSGAFLLLICDFLTKHEKTLVPPPSYLSQLAPGSFFLFPKLKSMLKERRVICRGD